MIFNKKVGHLVCGDKRFLNHPAESIEAPPRVYIPLQAELLKAFFFELLGKIQYWLRNMAWVHHILWPRVVSQEELFLLRSLL